MDALGSGCVQLREGGEITARITARQPVFACALGGPDRRTLFMVTAPRFREEACCGKGPGRIEVVEVDVPGA